MLSQGTQEAEARESGIQNSKAILVVLDEHLPFFNESIDDRFQPLVNPIKRIYKPVEELVIQVRLLAMDDHPSPTSGVAYVVVSDVVVGARFMATPNAYS